MHRTAAAIALTLAAIALAGCTASPEEKPEAAPELSIEPAVPTETPEPTPTPERNESPRGNLIKSIGEPFGYADPDNLDDKFGTAQFVVRSIVVDPECTGPMPEASEHGHFVRIDIEGETTPKIADTINGGLIMDAFSWKAIAENGTTFNGDLNSFAAQQCLAEEEMLPRNIGPAERVAGAVILDVPTPKGVAILEEPIGGSWEWAYPASE